MSLVDTYLSRSSLLPSALLWTLPFFNSMQQLKDEEILKDREKTIQDYQAKLKTAINPKNLKLYVDAFLKLVRVQSILRWCEIEQWSFNWLKCFFHFFSRKDMTGALIKNLKVDTLLLAGTKGSYESAVQHLHTLMDKQRTQLLIIDDVGDAINEAVSFTPFILLG